jgi:hypothetical protein
MRFIHNLLPLLHNAPGLSRSVSLLSAGNGGKVDIEDLALEKSYTASAVANHTVVMNDLMVEEFASRNPRTTFIHTEPRIVNTGLARELPLWARIGTKALYQLLIPFSVSAEETGQRQLFHATSALYQPKSPANNLSVAEGADGKKASGAYLVTWNGDKVKQKSFVLQYQKQGFGKIIWEHTMSVFERFEKLKVSPE